MKSLIRIDSKGTHYILFGKEVSEKQFRKYFPEPERAAMDRELLQPVSCSAWPILSDALAVHPKQIEEAIARDKKHGVQTDYTDDGRPILRDRDHRRRMMRSLGVHDNNGGYSD